MPFAQREQYMIKTETDKKQWQLETDMFEGQWGWRDRAGNSQGFQHILSRINRKT